MKNICVFCGSSFGNSPIYKEASIQLADELMRHQLNLIYGGAKVGLMGELANHFLKNNGHVIGVIPKFLADREVAHDGLTQLIEVNSMHERKEMMQNISDGFIAMPGGLGTVEEIFEMITWAQLDIHHKPCAFFNINGYYNHVFEFLKNAVQEGFIEREYKDMIIVNDDPEVIIQSFYNYEHPKVDKAVIALRKLKQHCSE